MSLCYLDRYNAQDGRAHFLHRRDRHDHRGRHVHPHANRGRVHRGRRAGSIGTTSKMS